MGIQWDSTPVIIDRKEVLYNILIDFAVPIKFIKMCLNEKYIQIKNVVFAYCR
jgi:hypothetical protein